MSVENTVYFLGEYQGTASREHLAVPIPSPAEIAHLCTQVHEYGHNVGLAYPREAPIFWIKYGPSVIWDELDSQSYAHTELKRLHSPVKVPAIYYACKLAVSDGIWSYVVMDYVPGSTVGYLLQQTDDADERELLFSRVALALSEMHRIPVPPGRPPSGINEGYIRHFLFDDEEALGSIRFLSKGKPKKTLIRGLSQEAMVFCYSDLWPHNFLVDDNGQTWVVDFAHASFLPASFSKMILIFYKHKIGRDLLSQVTIPTTDGIDNSRALCDAKGPMVQSSGSFVRAGERLFGVDPSRREKTTWTRRPLLNQEGLPIEVVLDVPPSPPRMLPPARPPAGWKPRQKHVVSKAYEAVADMRERTDGTDEDYRQ